MRVKSLFFHLDRSLMWNLIVLPRLKLSGLFETVDGNWKRQELVLWNLEEFLGCDQQMQPALEKTILQAVQQRLKQDCKFRKDAFQLKLRGPTHLEGPTILELFRWPADIELREQLYTSLEWETCMEKSPYATSKLYYWLSESFFLSLVEFALCNQPIYTEIAYALQKLQFCGSGNDIHCRWINRLDGRGLVRCRIVLPQSGDEDVIEKESDKKRRLFETSKKRKLDLAPVPQPETEIIK